MFLGIDVGTSSTKGVLTDRRGVVLDSVTIEHQVSFPRPGHVEFDAEVAWREISEIARRLVTGRDASAIEGLCVSAMGPCLVITGDDLVPLRPTILYGIDSRASAQVATLEREFGAAAIFERCGKTLSSQAGGPKLRWIRDVEPAVFAAATQWHSLAGWLVARLTGEHVIDHHTASQFDPLYDLRTGNWHPEWAPRIAEHLRMPHLAWSGEVVGGVSAEAGFATGLPSGLPVCAGTIDAWSEAVSAGVRSPGDLMLMYGSTMFFVEVLSSWRAHEKLWTTAGVAPGSLTMAAGMSTSGTLTQWVQRVTGGAPFEELVEEAQAVPTGSDGLLLLPYFAGERTPVFDDAARGVIVGLTLSHGRGHLLRAAYEGVAYGIRQVLAYLDVTGEPVRRLVAVGGGTKAALWTQIVSDVTGRPQDVPALTIGASYGDAMLAAMATGVLEPDATWARVATTIEPDAAKADLYAELFTGYESLYAATREHMHLLARIQDREHR
ncbi:MAG: sugar kinase [Salinibacterium sp.]|nr:sugar kinase [Cryobacterium sp.]MCB1281124.1 sugar kinase [Salinibacterium sp.]